VPFGSAAPMVWGSRLRWLVLAGFVPVVIGAAVATVLTWFCIRP
jgi:hypothetical protein